MKRFLPFIGVLLLVLGCRTGMVETAGYAYVVSSEGMHIIDVSDPTAPTEVSFVPISNASDVALFDNYAYVTINNEFGFRIIEVSNPTNPTEIGYYSLPGTANRGVEIVDGFAYIPDTNNGGIRIFDLSNPTHPSEAGYIPEGGAVAVRDKYAYIIGPGTNLRIVNVSNPMAIDTVGITREPGRGNSEVVKLSGKYAYVIGSTLGDSSEIRIYGVSNARNPELITLQLLENYSNGLEVADGYVYINSPRGIQIYELNSPTVLKFRNSLRGVGGNIAVMGNYAYIASSESMRIFNIANPDEPMEVGSINVKAVNVVLSEGFFTEQIPIPALNDIQTRTLVVGSEAIVTGKNLTEVTEVKLNGQVVTTFSTTDDQIVFEVPDGATTGVLTVTAPGGRASSAYEFIVLPAPPSPVITNYSPISGKPGDKVTITGTNLGPVTSVTFNGTASATILSNTLSNIVVEVPIGANSGKIIVVTPNGTAISESSFTVK